MQSYTITVLAAGEESKVVVWKAIPNVGDIVVLGPTKEYEVIQVIHQFRRGIDNANGEITLEVLPRRVKQAPPIS